MFCRGTELQRDERVLMDKRTKLTDEIARLTLAYDTSTSVESCPEGFSQNEAKSCLPTRRAAAPLIAPTSSASLIHQTYGLPNAVLLREIR